MFGWVYYGVRVGLGWVGFGLVGCGWVGFRLGLGLG